MPGRSRDGAPSFPTGSTPRLSFPRTAALLALLHLGPCPGGLPGAAWAEPVSADPAKGGEVEALFAWRAGAQVEGSRAAGDVPRQPRQEGEGIGQSAGLNGGEGDPAQAAEPKVADSTEADEALDAWASERLEDFRRRAAEGVPLEESLAFAEELRARDAGYWLGEALIHVGHGRMLADEVEEALNDWGEAARLGVVWGRPGTSARAHNSIGFGLQRSGDLITARNHFELAVFYSQSDEGKGYRVNLASCEMGLGNLGRAFDQFASVVHELSDAQACIAYYNLSGICLTAELFEAAARLSDSCLRKYELDPEEVQRMVGSTIEVLLLLHHAECLQSLDDDEGIREALEKADAAQAALAGMSPWALAEVLSSRASISLQNEEYAAALEVLAPLVRDLQRHGRPPSYLDPHVQRLQATALRGAGRPREALEVLDRVDSAQVSPGSYLEYDLNQLRARIWKELAQSLAGASQELADGSARVTEASDASWAEREEGRRDWRHAERRIIQANFARPELADLLGDLSAIGLRPEGQGLAEEVPSESGGSAADTPESGSSRPAAIVALIVAGLLAICSLVVGLRARQRAEKVQQLECLVDELRTQRREVADRAAAVSHDLRAPVLALRCCLDLLGLDESSPNVRSRIEPMRKGLDHIIRLADDSLLLHGLAASDESNATQPCDLAQVIRPVLDLWRPLAARKGLELVFDVAPGSHLWAIPEDHAVRMVENLLSNAVKFAEGPGRVSISLATEGGRGRFAIEDCGPGLPEHELPRLFEPMARLTPRPTDNEVSSGLGASIVRALAERSGGSVHAANNASGRGLTVSVHWPALDPDATPGPLANRTPQVEREPEATGVASATTTSEEQSPQASPGRRG